jgi:hypothetical protein
MFRITKLVSLARHAHDDHHFVRRGLFSKGEYPRRHESTNSSKTVARASVIDISPTYENVAHRASLAEEEGGGGGIGGVVAGSIYDFSHPTTDASGAGGVGYEQPVDTQTAYYDGLNKQAAEQADGNITRAEATADGEIPPTAALASTNAIYGQGFAMLATPSGTEKGAHAELPLMEEPGFSLAGASIALPVQGSSSTDGDPSSGIVPVHGRRIVAEHHRTEQEKRHHHHHQIKEEVQAVKQSI